MDVLGGISAIINIIDTGQKTFNFLRSIPGIQNEWELLNDEISAVRQVLVTVENLTFGAETDSYLGPLMRMTFKQLESSLTKLNALLTKTTRVVDCSGSAKKETEASKRKWVHYKSDIVQIRNEVRDAKDNLQLALGLVQGRQNAINHQLLQAIQIGVAGITFQVEAGFSEMHQRQSICTTNHLRQSNGKCLLEAEKSSSGDVSPTTMSPTFDSALGGFPDRIPGVCPRPCICSCHRSKPLFWVGCNYGQCRRTIPSRRTHWSLNLVQWLTGYGVSLTISASLRPQGVVPLDDIKVTTIQSQNTDREIALRHLQLVHPLDIITDGISFMNLALLTRHIVAVEVLLSLWRTYLLQHGLDRAHILLADESCSEREQHALRTLISYSDEDATCGPTALHRAIEDGSSRDVLEALHHEPSSVDVLDLQGFSPMHLAVSMESNALPILSAMKDKGANIMHRDSIGQTPLMHAAFWGNLEATEWLLKQDPNNHKHRDDRGRLALHHALQSDTHRSVDVIEALLKAGANPSSLDIMRGTPLHLMKFSKADYLTCKARIKLLLDAGADINAKDNFGETPLLLVMMENKIEAIRALIDMGASLKSKDRNGRSSCHFAALYCNENTLWNLVKHKTFRRADVDIFAIDNDKDSPWDCFILTLHLPAEAITGIIRTTEERCRAFDGFYNQARNFQLQSDIDRLQRVSILLRKGEIEKASTELLTLANEKEPRDLWATDVSMQPLRSIHLQVQMNRTTLTDDFDLTDELNAIGEQVNVLEAKMEESPWEYDSRWWRDRPQKEGASNEDWERQAEFAKLMREKGLERWRNTRMNCGSSRDSADDSETRLGLKLD